MIYLLGIDHWLQEYELYSEQDLRTIAITDKESAYRKARFGDWVDPIVGSLLILLGFYLLWRI